MSAATRLPPLLENRPPVVKVVLAGVTPAAYGLLTGFVLGWSGGVYIVLQILAAFGGLGAGLEHRGPGSGARRGVLGGALYGSFILIAHELSNEAPEVHLAHPAITLAIVTAAVGALLGALGGNIRSRIERRPA